MKYLVFQKDVYDGDKLIWGKKCTYKVIDELDDIYMLNTIDGVSFGIEKIAEGDVFICQT